MVNITEKEILWNSSGLSNIEQYVTNLQSLIGSSYSMQILFELMQQIIGRQRIFAWSLNYTWHNCRSFVSQQIVLESIWSI